MLSNLFLCIVLTMFGAFGGYFFKKASSKESISKIRTSPFLYLGGIFYLVGAILNIIVLKRLNYIVALPLTSLTYVWSMMISYRLLKETISIKKIIGLFMIIGGAIILGLNS